MKTRRPLSALVTSTLIQVNGNGDGTTLRGFYVRNAGSTGIQVRLSGEASAFTNLCEDVRIQGNKVENSRQDGIKAHQCNHILVEGNRVAGFSKGSDAGNEHEHGIDFVAVGACGHWVKLRNLDTLALQSGSVTFRVKNREKGVAIDRFFLTSDPSALPWPDALSDFRK
ncbi:right-handed parallel beta-helix repeat-containing protein [Myxococcus xanthus]|uniref:right-handed parallel beta-helix repeat-containing protein n=1 Tax=Myxococcus xanthus TaxID=34 RepID=UPI0011635709|nr:right-handed parallel beta-helix repeat-containing protein [Myxococcus xanthus]QDE80683.1 hypothetical protein BHS07_03440 [Myxococcus xanthus]